MIISSSFITNSFLTLLLTSSLSITEAAATRQVVGQLRGVNSHRELSTPTSTQLAFPGASGYGRHATGGRGGDVYIVTSLDDSGSGTLREAIDAPGKRTVVFAVSGYIDLNTQLSIDNGDITIAGQTSPNGITIRGSRLKIKASNVIVRGMRFRPGDDSTGGDSNCNNKDGFGVGTGAAITDIIFDHCSATWAMDENGSSWYTSSRTTVSNCLFAEGLDKQCSSDGGFGYLIGTNSGNPPPNQISLLRNVFISNRDRNPLIKDGATEIEVINNLSYNHKGSALGYGSPDVTTVSAINNYFKHGPDSYTRPSCYLHAYENQDSLMNVHVNGNIDNCFGGSETAFCHKKNNLPVSEAEVNMSGDIFPGSGYGSSAIDAIDVPTDVTAYAGAIHPIRDGIDARILATANVGNLDCSDKGSGALITSVAQVGGYPTVLNDNIPADTDEDGIPDYMETTYGLDPTMYDSNITSPSGYYTYLEEYLNSFYSSLPTPSPGPTSPPSPAPTKAPSSTEAPTKSPSSSPSSVPTRSPSQAPTNSPALQSGASVASSGLTGIWSDGSTWESGTAPAQGNDVIIKGGSIVELDLTGEHDFPSIQVMEGATLRITSANLLLKTSIIHVHHMSKFEAGTEANPLMGQVTIRLVGEPLPPVEPVAEDHGNKALVAHHGSTFDLHGAPRTHTWTRLAQTVLAGSNTIVVDSLSGLDWIVGEQIAISSSDFDVAGFNEQFEAQQLTIASITHGADTTSITTVETLEYTHWGEEQYYGGIEISTPAEVVLLSRNVVIEGDMDVASAEAGWGGHLKMHTEGGVGRVSYCEFRNMGQRSILGRYPIHFHVPGDATGSKAIGNSVHHTFNRAITVHGAHNIEVKFNVIFEGLGHAIYLEDGTESGNIFEKNVVFNTRQGSVPDTDDGTPASYWISNPNNIFIDNVAAGSHYTGFWIIPEKTAPKNGPVTACPRYAPLGEFRGNVAHSNKKYGLEISRWLPKAGGGCSDGDVDQQAVLHDTLVFKNGYNGVRFVGTGGNGAIIMDGIVAVDNARTYQTSAAVFYGGVYDELPTGLTGIRNGVFAQYTNNNGFCRDPLTGPTRRGFHLPQTDNLFIENSTFINYGRKSASDKCGGEGWIFDPDRTRDQSDTSSVGFELRTKGLSFINSPNRVHFRFKHHGIISDLDGSLTETNGPKWVVADTPLYDRVKCNPAPASLATIPATYGESYEAMFHSVPLLVCDGDYPIRRLGRGEMQPDNSLSALQTWTNNGYSEMITSFSSGRYTIASPTNTTIDVNFDQGVLPTAWYQQIGDRFGQNDYIHWRFLSPTHKLASYNIIFGAWDLGDIDGDGNLFEIIDHSSQELGSIPNGPTRGHYFDIATGVLHVMFADAKEITLNNLVWEHTTLTGTGPPSLSPTAAPTQAPSMSPIVVGRAGGVPCTNGQQCESGFCGSTDGTETKCLDSSLLCASSP